MYFEKFPKTIYTLDEYKSGQVVTDILRRTKFVEQLTQNFSFFDEYDVQDGETPEIVADLFYNDPQLHWIILQANEIIDPRFDWPLSQNQLNDYIAGKYSNVNSIHHFEDSSGNQIEVKYRVISTSNTFFNLIQPGEVIENNTNPGLGYLTNETISLTSGTIIMTSGGIQSGDKLYKKLVPSSNVIVGSLINITANSYPVSVTEYETEINESKRRIKVVKPELVSEIINNFETIIKK